MAKNTKQIALIQNRHGKANELPKQLSTGEFGFADDTNQLFIGNGDHPTLKERLNSNIFPYGNVEIVTEFSDIPEIAKYSPKMNGIKVNYPIKLMGTKTFPEVQSGSSIIVNDKEVVFEDEVVVKEYDYLVLKYIWTDGIDLDTDTRFTNLDNFPEINNKGVGFYDNYYNNPPYGGPQIRNKHFGPYELPYQLDVGEDETPSASISYLYSAGDNRGIASITSPKEENILISRNNIINDNNYELLPENIQIQLSGTWYNTIGHNTVMIEICAYKGGVMEYSTSTYKYTNIGGEEVIFGYDTQGNPITTLSLEVNNLSDDLHEYRTLGYITINKETGNTTISTTGESSSGNSSIVQITYDIEKIVQRINEECSDVEASIVDNKICLKTFKEILVLEDGIDIDDNNTLESLGFTENVYLADKLTKRSVQDVLDDRYSIKAFDVMGDGFTDDSKGINLATEILYTFDKSDDKELYFPADTYVINNNTLNLLSNTHFVGEGIDRTIIKSKSNLQTLLATVDQQLRKPDDKNYCIEIPGIENVYNARFKFKDNFFNTYGKIKNVIFTCIRYNSEELGSNDWQYIASVHFEKGVLPISISKDNSNAVYHKESFEFYSDNNEANNYNSATPVDYINCIGEDMPNQMIWTRHSKEKANKDYTVAKKYGWNYGYEKNNIPTMDTNRYTFEINNAGTELKIKDNANNDLIVLYDDIVTYMDFPHNIMIEDMTFDVSESNSSEIIKLGHSYNITFKNCKFITKNVSDILNTALNSKLKDIKFIDCIFEGNNSIRSQIIINGQLDGLLITNCEFNNIKNSVIVLNANEYKIKNGIIANNKFVNCAGTNIPLVSVNENVEYVNVVKSMVEYPFLTNEMEVLNRWDGDYNYCDTPNMLNDHNKYVRCTFYQDIYDYVQALYTKYGKNALEVVSPDRDIETTNYIKLITGTDENEHTLSLNATNQTGNVEFNMGKYGDLLVGKDSNIIEDWKPKYPYNVMDLITINQTLYRCVVEHTSKTYFEPNMWLEITDDDILEWVPDTQYAVNDFVSHNDNIYKCKVRHKSNYTFTESYWDLIADKDTAIVLFKNLDVNDSVIENRTDNDIVFRADSNALIVDDSRSEIPYKDRIADKYNALTTVGFVNDSVRSSVKEKFDVETINQKVGEEKSSELLLCDFDSSRYGNEVYFKDASINVRQLFIPIGEQVQAIYPNECEFIDWDNKILGTDPNTYDETEVIEILNPNTDNYEYYKCLVSHTCTTSQATEWDNFNDELSRGYWQLTTDINYFTGYSSRDYDNIDWYKGDVVRYIRFDEGTGINPDVYFFPESWGKIVNVKQTVTSNEAQNGYVYALSIRFKNGYVLPVIIRRHDNAKCTIDWDFNLVEQTDITTYNSATYVQGSNIWINSKGKDVSTLDSDGFMVWEHYNDGWYDVKNKNRDIAKNQNWDEGHLVDNKTTVNTSRFIITFEDGALVIKDSYRNNEMLGVFYYKYFENSDGEIRFYICKKDHTATTHFDKEESLDNDIALGYWDPVLIDVDEFIRVFDDEGYAWTIDDHGTEDEGDDMYHLTTYIGGKVYIILPQLRSVIKTVPDLKYISLKLVDKLNREADKWLFPIDDVNLIYRNTNGYTYPLWQPETTYQNGDMVRFNYSNFECIAQDDLGNPISYTSGESHIDLHNPDVWNKLDESGYDYRFHFERDFLERDGSGRFYLEDHQFVHNIADHKLYICFYDNKGDNIKLLKYDMSKYFEYKEWISGIPTTYYEGDYLRYNNSIYVVRATYTTDGTFREEVDYGQTEWQPHHQYYGCMDPVTHEETRNGDYVKYEDKLYQVQYDYISGDEFQTIINDTVVLSEVEATWKLLSKIEHTIWTPLSNFYKNQYISYNDEVYQVVDDYVSSEQFDIDYKNGMIKLVPTYYMQLGRSGELLINVKYSKEND